MNIIDNYAPMLIRLQISNNDYPGFCEVIKEHSIIHPTKMQLIKRWFRVKEIINDI